VSPRDALFDLLERVWGERPDAREFEWWFDEAPGGPALLTTEQDGDRVVGLASMSFLRCRVGGVGQLVPIPLQVATDPEYRGRGIFARLERANEETAIGRGCAVAVTFPNDASRPIFLERLGWDELWRGRVWVRPPLPALGRRATSLTSIPAGVDELAGSANGQIADAAFLDWRYLRSPRGYRILGAFEGDRLRGLLALRPRRGRVAVVCHALGEVGGLLRAAGSALPTIALVPPAQRGAFARAGFLPTPKSIRVLGKQLRPEGSLAGEWQFQLGDFDVF
jgi:GNAT superfamily N-acetyltransferase